MFGPEELDWGVKIKKGKHVLVREAAGDGVLHVENNDVPLRAGKVRHEMLQQQLEWTTRCLSMRATNPVYCDEEGG